MNELKRAAALLGKKGGKKKVPKGFAITGKASEAGKAKVPKGFAVSGKASEAGRKGAAARYGKKNKK